MEQLSIPQADQPQTFKKTKPEKVTSIHQEEKNCDSIPQADQLPTFKKTNPLTEKVKSIQKEEKKWYSLYSKYQISQSDIR